ncbi:unnamed protein product [Protopolystoma xenopodis]|uniref:Uncharacterized protein n=1 Tax=Protopolystoma xenopodis TaxID=117903 RepID=A0A3S5B8M4_9PLAT|nr:unnamed protein product [Protopolystoma xenopodis]
MSMPEHIYYIWSVPSLPLNPFTRARFDVFPVKRLLLRQMNLREVYDQIFNCSNSLDPCHSALQTSYFGQSAGLRRLPALGDSIGPRARRSARYWPNPTSFVSSVETGATSAGGIAGLESLYELTSRNSSLDTDPERRDTGRPGSSFFLSTSSAAVVRKPAAAASALQQALNMVRTVDDYIRKPQPGDPGHLGRSASLEATISLARTIETDLSQASFPGRLPVKRTSSLLPYDDNDDWPPDLSPSTRLTPPRGDTDGQKLEPGQPERRSPGKPTVSTTSSFALVRSHRTDSSAGRPTRSGATDEEWQSAQTDQLDESSGLGKSIVWSEADEADEEANEADCLPRPSLPSSSSSSSPPPPPEPSSPPSLSPQQPSVSCPSTGLGLGSGGGSRTRRSRPKRLTREADASSTRPARSSFASTSSELIATEASRSARQTATTCQSGEPVWSPHLQPTKMGPFQCWIMWADLQQALPLPRLINGLASRILRKPAAFEMNKQTVEIIDKVANLTQSRGLSLRRFFSQRHRFPWIDGLDGETIGSKTIGQQWLAGRDLDLDRDRARSQAQARISSVCRQTESLASMRGGKEPFLPELFVKSGFGLTPQSSYLRSVKGPATSHLVGEHPLAGRPSRFCFSGLDRQEGLSSQAQSTEVQQHRLLVETREPDGQTPTAKRSVKMAPYICSRPLPLRPGQRVRFVLPDEIAAGTTISAPPAGIGEKREETSSGPSSDGKTGSKVGVPFEESGLIWHS